MPVRIERSTFKNVREVLDGKQYISCVFENCELVFAATAPVGLTNCTFKDVRWTLEGAAALTMQFLAGLYHGAGKGGQDLVENTFAAIKKSPPPAAR